MSANAGSAQRGRTACACTDSSLRVSDTHGAPRRRPARRGAKKKSGLPPFYASGPVQGQSGSARAAAMRSSVTGSK